MAVDNKHWTAWDKVLLEKIRGTQVMNIFCAVTAQLGTRPPHCWSFQTTHRHPHPIGLLWTSDQHENCTHLGYYAASSGNSLSAFRDRYVVPKRRWYIITTRCVMTQKSADLICFAAKAWCHAEWSARSQMPLSDDTQTNTRDERPCPQRDSNHTVPAIEQLQTYALNRMVVGMGS